jgi:hypothetical protein
LQNNAGIEASIKLLTRRMHSSCLHVNRGLGRKQRLCSSGRQLCIITCAMTFVNIKSTITKHTHTDSYNKESIKYHITQPQADNRIKPQKSLRQVEVEVEVADNQRAFNNSNYAWQYLQHHHWQAESDNQSENSIRTECLH